jgi:hypothetical protein
MSFVWANADSKTVFERASGGWPGLEAASCDDEEARDGNVLECLGEQG